VKAHLLFEDEDFVLGITFSRRMGFAVTGPELPARTLELAQDLELGTLLRAMAGGDALLFDIAKFALLCSLADPRQITYRQDILSDCIARPGVVREIYAIAVEAIVGESEIYHPFGGHPSGVLRRSVEVLEMLVGLLKRLREIADDHHATVTSRGLTTLFAMLREELDDEYFQRVDDHLNRLKFKSGMLMSAKLGRANRGVGYVLRAPNKTRRSWKERVGIGPRTSYDFQLHPRDEAGGRMLSEMNDRGVNLVANALAQSTDHILSFFTLLCGETGFYVSCLNVYDELVGKGEPICTPVPLPSDLMALSFHDIYDVSLALRCGSRVVGNEAKADGKSLIMVTGANSGGKSTLLRSIGLAQLMMQCGMLVGANAFRANVAEGLFTHFIREEDKTMTSGKLDEELARMSAIADLVTPRSIILFNESFAATNEREGSEIARQIIEALLDAGVKVVCVTHQFTLANALHSRNLDTALFLRAEREIDGRRTFKLVEGEPLPTSFGQDLYRRIGGLTRAPAMAPVGADVGLSESDGAGRGGDE
jgi:DNA mismatch repair ATPase MutS